MSVIQQESEIEVRIPEGGHGEVSKCLSRTITNVRTKPAAVYADEYFNPSALLDSIQAKLVLDNESAIVYHNFQGGRFCGLPF